MKTKGANDDCGMTYENLEAALQNTLNRIEELEAKLKSEQASVKYYGDQNREIRAELDAVHNTIDLLPNAPPRQSDFPEGEQWRATTYSVQNRLTAWIATRLK